MAKKEGICEKALGTRADRKEVGDEFWKRSPSKATKSDEKFLRFGQLVGSRRKAVLLRKIRFHTP